MNLFELFGTITIKNEEANAALDETMGKAEKLNETLNNTGGSSSGGSKTGGSSSTGTTPNKSGTVVLPTKKSNSWDVMVGNLKADAVRAGLSGAKNFFRLGYDYYNTMEQGITSYEVMLGDIQKSEKLMEEIVDLAVETPLEIQNLQSNATMLLNYGMEHANVVPTLEMLGNSALGDPKKLSGITRAYGQIASYGNLRAQEGYQLIENGFPIYEYLGKLLKTDVGSVIALRESGSIPFSMVQKAFELATSEGERYYNAMYKYTDTLEGKLTKTKEKLAMTSGEVMGPFLEVFSDTVLTEVDETLDGFKEWATENEEKIEDTAEFLGEQIVNGNAGHAATAAGIAMLAKSHPIAKGLGLVATGTHWASTKVAGTVNEHRQQALDAGDIETVLSIDNKLSKLSSFLTGGKSGTSGYSGASGKFGDTLASGYSGASGKFSVTLPDAGATAEEITAWFAEVDPDLMKEMGITPPGASATAAEIMAWWQSVRPSLTAYYSVQPTSSAASILRKGAGGMGISAIQLGAETPGFATGLDYVPRDNYLARLHQGEAVLTRNEADAWRSGGNTGRVEALLAQMNGLLQSIAQNTGVDRTVMLDTGIMVGQLAPRMNMQLGMQNRRSARG